MRHLILMVWIAILSIPTIQAQEIAEIEITPDGKSIRINFDCRTMSHAPLQRLFVTNEGRAEGLLMLINKELLNLSVNGFILNYLPPYLRVEYNDAGQLQKLLDKNSKFLMQISYYEDGRIMRITERNSKSTIRIKYDKEGFLKSVTDTRHRLKLLFDYREGLLYKFGSGYAFSTHIFIYDNRQLEKIKQRGHGVLVDFDYTNGYINRVHDQDSPIPIFIENRW